MCGCRVVRLTSAFRHRAAVLGGTACCMTAPPHPHSTSSMTPSTAAPYVWRTAYVRSHSLSILPASLWWIRRWKKARIPTWACSRSTSPTARPASPRPWLSRPRPWEQRVRTYGAWSANARPHHIRSTSPCTVTVCECACSVRNRRVSIWTARV